MRQWMFTHAQRLVHPAIEERDCMEAYFEGSAKELDPKTIVLDPMECCQSYEFRSQGDSVRFMSTTPDGKFLVAAFESLWIRLVDTENAMLVKV